MVTFEEFKKFDIRVAQIKAAEDHPDADRLLVLTIAIGTQEKRIVAGIKKDYNRDELVGKKVVVIANIEPAKIRGIESSAMLLAARDECALALLVPEKEISSGSKVS